MWKCSSFSQTPQGERKGAAKHGGEKWKKGEILSDAKKRARSRHLQTRSEGEKTIYIYTHICLYVCVCICIYTQMVFALHKGTALNTVKWFLRGTITAFYTQFIHTYHDMLEWMRTGLNIHTPIHIK